MLQLLPKFAGNQTKTESITVPEELGLVRQNFFLLVQSKFLSPGNKSLLKSSTISKTSSFLNVFPFGYLRTNGHTLLVENAKFGTKIAKFGNRWISPPVSAASTQGLEPPRGRFFQGFDPTDFLHSATSHDVKVYSVEKCYMSQTQSGNFHTNQVWPPSWKTRLKISSIHQHPDRLLSTFLCFR